MTVSLTAGVALEDELLPTGGGSLVVLLDAQQHQHLHRWVSGDERGELGEERAERT